MNNICESCGGSVCDSCGQPAPMLYPFMRHMLCQSCLVANYKRAIHGVNNGQEAKDTDERGDLGESADIGG